MSLSALILSVALLPSPFLDNLKRERAVMESIDPHNLTWTFRVNAGLDSLANTNTVLRLGGWERPDIELRGHTAGHWLSGMAALYETTRDDSVKSRAAIVVHELKRCQDALKTGWIGAFPESDIDRIIAGIRVWAPWYVEHKILQGLLDQYEICGNAEALAVARRFGDWVADKVLALSSEQAAVMRRREFGGIGEALRNLARITGDARYGRAADVFDDPRILDPLRERREALAGKHANTCIPKVIAEMRKWEMHGDTNSLVIAERFLDQVISHHLYAAGCVSEREGFKKPDTQGAHLTGYTGETCCTYNLLKLSRMLFAATKRPDIADYQERALWNHILGQSEPLDGRVTYFLPMATGCYKLQNRANDSFWCCQASAMESQVKFGRLVFAKVGGVLYVNQFIPCRWSDGDMEVVLETDFPVGETARLTVVRGEGDVAVRRPFWVTGATASTYEHRHLKAGETVKIVLPCSLRTEAPPDAPGRKAVFWGPILLAGRLGTENLTTADLRSLNYYTHDYKVPERLSHVALEDPATWTRLSRPPAHPRVMDDASYDAEPYWGEPTFRTPSGIVISPLWCIHNERYVVYWN